jgi:hypothetical protein
MSVTKRPMHPIESLLDQKIEEAGLDLTDVQVNEVIKMLIKVMRQNTENLKRLLDRARAVVRGRISPAQFKAWVEEQNEAGGDMQHLYMLLCNAEIDLDDEAVNAAVLVAEDVLAHFLEGELFVA